MRSAEFGMGNTPFISVSISSLPLCRFATLPVNNERFIALSTEVVTTNWQCLPEAGAAVLRDSPVSGGVLVAFDGANGRRGIAVV